MGTRGLTVVVCNKSYVVAQYGQWDHYPSGQGLVALNFCRDRLAHDPGRDDFMLRLAKLKYVNQDEARAADPTPIQFSRNMGAKVLEYVWNVGDEGDFRLVDSLDFAADSLFCEYVWLVDLDTNTFEAFKGFNQTPLDYTDRFSFLSEQSFQSHRTQQYCPVKLTNSWSLNSLPTDEEFLAVFRENDSETGR